MNTIPKLIICIVCSFTTVAMANPLLAPPKELVGKHHGAMGQFGKATKDGQLSFGGDEMTLGGIELKADGELIVPFALKGESFKSLSFKFHESAVSGTAAVWLPLQDGNVRYSANLFRYGSVFRVLVKQHHEDGSVSAIQWICAEPREEEKAVTRPELKSEDGNKSGLKLEDDSKSQSKSQPWENNRLTHDQPFSARVIAVASSWVGYKLLLEEADVKSPRYCYVEIYRGGRLRYVLTDKDESSDMATRDKIEPVLVSDFSVEGGLFKLGRKFGEEDLLLTVIAESKHRK